MSKMKKQMYSHDSKDMGKPKMKDMQPKSGKKGFGVPAYPTMEKQIMHKPHKAVDGPSEMKSTGGGPVHKGIKGESEMKESKLGMGHKMAPYHEADGVKGDLHAHLGKFGEKGNLKKGHVSLEKVSADSFGEYADDKGVERVIKSK